MAHPKEKKTQARSLYVHSRYALAVIAVQLDVSAATINRWKASAREGGDDWDIAKSADMMAGEGFEKMVSNAVGNFTVMFQTTMEAVQDEPKLGPADKVKLMASLGDSFNKMINASGRAAPSLSKLGIATDVVQRLAEFVREHFPEHKTAFLEILEPFGVEISKAYSE